VVTTDFFTPVVDDAYDYGSIAAANSLSDVYAMGGQPFLALNVAALPPDLPVEIGAEILRGGAEKCLEAGVVIAGGHTIQDKEPKYGLVVIGFVELEQMIRKSQVRPGDSLVLTKPLGFGVTTTALKQDKAAPEDVAEALERLRESYRQVLEGAADRTHSFFPESEVLAALKRVGFAGTRVHSELEVEYHPDVPDLLRSLKRIGAGSAAPAAGRGLAERRVMLDMMERYRSSYGADGRIPATYQVTYGWGVA